MLRMSDPIRPTRSGIGIFCEAMPVSAKIELHLHLEGTVRPAMLLAIGRRNGVALPGRDVHALGALYTRRRLPELRRLWALISSTLRRSDDFREVTVSYAAEAQKHGAVYLEAIFSPVEPARLGVGLDELFSGYCDGCDQAREEFGIEIRLAPDITRGCDAEEADAVVDYAIAFRDRGVVGVGLGGRDDLSPEPYVTTFARARAEGLAVLPHAGEFADAEFLRRDLTLLHPTRIRHGIRGIDDRGLLAEIVDRGIVLDVCPTSNVCLGTVDSLKSHPLPRLVSAGARCSVSTDDPALFGTDLSREYEIATSLGVEASDILQSALCGAQCDEATRSRIRQAVLAPP
jgi:aminodeoxyfutalosine deaminase